MGFVNKLVIVIVLGLFVMIIQSYGLGIVTTHDQAINVSGTAYESQYNAGEQVEATSMNFNPWIIYLLGFIALIIVFKALQSIV